jgi:hypothetical protein
MVNPHNGNGGRGSPACAMPPAPVRHSHAPVHLLAAYEERALHHLGHKICLDARHWTPLPQHPPPPFTPKKFILQGQHCSLERAGSSSAGLLGQAAEKERATTEGAHCQDLQETAAHTAWPAQVWPRNSPGNGGTELRRGGGWGRSAAHRVIDQERFKTGKRQRLMIEQPRTAACQIRVDLQASPPIISAPLEHSKKLGQH